MAVWLSELPPEVMKLEYVRTLASLNDTLSKLPLQWKVAGMFEKLGILDKQKKD